MGAIITLTTDFGLSDAYVAAMKGVILGINPEATIVDISHDITPQNILEAAFVLGTAYEFFPQRTVHLAVVDPGVGTKRRAIILRTPVADFVAPDNGVLSYVIAQSSTVPTDSTGQQIELKPNLEAVAITKPDFWRSPVSSTFHGRDIFAPVAAHLSLGLSPTDFGETINSVAVLPLHLPYRTPDGTLVGHVIHIDSFGNLTTNIRSRDLPEPAKLVSIIMGKHTISGLSPTYAEGEGLLALIGSSGYLEIALARGNARAVTGAEVGSELRIRW